MRRGSTKEGWRGDMWRQRGGESERRRERERGGGRGREKTEETN